MELGDQQQEAALQPPQEPKQPEAPDENNDEGERGLAPARREPQEREAPDWFYKSIENVSKNAAKVYLVFMAFLSYAALTAVSTPDRGLVLNDKAHLPIVNIDVSANGFFVVAPLLVILTFLYLQLYIQKQMDLVASLSRQYGHLEANRLYPWIVNLAAYPSPGFMGKLQRLSVAFCIWMAPVIVLNIVSVSYLRHHGYSPYVVASIALVGTVGIVLFSQAYGTRRTGQKFLVSSLVVSVLVVIFEVSILAWVIPWANEGAYVSAPDSLWLRAASAIRPLVTVDLNSQKFVDTNLRGAKLQGADLRGADFEGADFEEADLAEADLTGTKLNRTKLQYTNLQGTWFRDADLCGADFQGADFRGADFWNADLQGARNLTVGQLSQVTLFYRVKLASDLLKQIREQHPDLLAPNFQKCDVHGLDFRGEDLHGANFQGNNLQGVNFQGTDLQGANLTDVHDLTIDQLATVKTLYRAKLDEGLLKKVQANYPNLLKEPPLEAQSKKKPE